MTTLLTMLGKSILSIVSCGPRRVCRQHGEVPMQACNEVALVTHGWKAPVFACACLLLVAASIISLHKHAVARHWHARVSGCYRICKGDGFGD